MKMTTDAMAARTLQIRRAHASAKPTDQNPAWLNSHIDVRHLLEHIDMLNKTSAVAELREALVTAIARIADMLLEDDGQAFKEARKWLPKLKATLAASQADAQPVAIEPIDAIERQVSNRTREILSHINVRQKGGALLDIVLVEDTLAGGITITVDTHPALEPAASGATGLVPLSACGTMVFIDGVGAVELAGQPVQLAAMPGFISKLRDAVQALRRTPKPIAEVGPLLQQAADRIEQLERRLAARTTAKGGELADVMMSILDPWPVGAAAADRVAQRGPSAEQQARDMLERMGVNDAQSFTAGDVVELANLIAARRIPEWLSYDPVNDALKIHGITYAADLFKEFDSTLPIGVPFKIVARDNGTIAVSRLDSPSAADASGLSEGDHPPHRCCDCAACAEYFAPVFAEYDRRAAAMAVDAASVRDAVLEEAARLVEDTAVDYEDRSSHQAAEIRAMKTSERGAEATGGILTSGQMRAIAKAIAVRVAANTGKAAELCFAPALFVLEDHFGKPKDGAAE